MSESMIRDISLADEGLQRISWVEKFMPALNTLREEFVKEQIFKGKTIVMSIHLEAKTAYLALTLKAAGANVICTGSNPLSTQDPIAAGLVKSGITVYAWHACTEEEYFMFLNKALDHMPDIIIDDGGDLVHLLHTTRKECQKNLIGGSEETTTGVYRLKILEKENKLEFPMIAVNDSYCKYLFDNRYGTGQSAWDGIIRSTNLTVTGDIDIITEPHFLAMKDGAICANAGHFDCEVSRKDLERIAVSHYEARKNIEGYVLPNGKTVFLMAEGRLVNLAAGDGHPAEIMDLSFAMQTLAARYLLQHGKDMKPAVYTLPHELDTKIASIKLAAMGYQIDTLTEAQRKYLGLD